MRYIVDTHVLVRWLADPRRLSKEQFRILNDLIRVQEPVGVSAITLVELASLAQDNSQVGKFNFEKILDVVESGEAFTVLPISTKIARDAARLLPVLRDPADTLIAATALAHGLRLLTSDARIVDTNCVATIP